MEHYENWMVAGWKQDESRMGTGCEHYGDRMGVGLEQDEIRMNTEWK